MTRISINGSELSEIGRDFETIEEALNTVSILYPELGKDATVEREGDDWYFTSKSKKDGIK